MMRSRRRQQPIAPTRLRAVVGAGAVQERAASAAGTGPAEQQLLLLGQLPPQRGVLGAQHGVVAAQAGDLAVAPVRGVALPPPGLPGERLGGAAAGGVGGHFVGKGHAVLGAAAGCAVGHHRAKVAARKAAAAPKR